MKVSLNPTTILDEKLIRPYREDGYIYTTEVTTDTGVKITFTNDTKTIKQDPSIDQIVEEYQIEGPIVQLTKK